MRKDRNSYSWIQEELILTDEEIAFVAIFVQAYICVWMLSTTKILYEKARRFRKRNTNNIFLYQFFLLQYSNSINSHSHLLNKYALSCTYQVSSFTGEISMGSGVITEASTTFTSPLSITNQLQESKVTVQLFLHCIHWGNRRLYLMFETELFSLPGNF